MRSISVIACVGLALTCRAEWQDIPLESVVSNSDLIVVATLTNVERVETNKSVRCRGTLQIEQVLKGPSAKTAILKWGFSIPPKEDSTDHTSLSGRSLIWLLKRSSDESYDAGYIKRVQSLDKKDEIERMIKGAPNPP